MVYACGGVASSFPTGNCWKSSGCFSVELVDEAEQGASGEKASSIRYYRIVFLCEAFQASTEEEKDLTLMH